VLAFTQSDQVLPQPSAVQIVACVLIGEKVVRRSEQVELVVAPRVGLEPRRSPVQRVSVRAGSRQNTRRH